MLHGWRDASAAGFGGPDPLPATIRRLLPLAAFVGALLLGHAAFDAVPTVVAEREGGMGLGSALIVAQVFGVAGIGAGAIAAASLVDRGRASTAAVAGALILYLGMTALGTAPTGALAWVTAAYGLAGAGLGALATCAFSIAAGLDRQPRVAAIVLLLLAPIASRGLAGPPAGPLPQVGPAALIVSGAIVVALAVLAVHGSPGGWARAERDGGDRQWGGRPVPGRAALAGGAVVTLGVVGVLAGADPSRLSATMLAGPLGVDLAALDGVRVALAVAGLAMILAGGALLVARAATARAVPTAAAATALIAVAAAGLIALLSLVVSAGGVLRPSPAIGVAGFGATVIGLALGGWWLSRSGPRRRVALAGSLVLSAAVAAGLVGAQVMGPDGASAIPILAAASMAGFGGGLAAPALRLALAEVAVPHRGLAAALGVAGAASGAVLGSMIGSAVGRALSGGVDQALPVGAALLFAAALGALGLAGLLPGRSVSPAR